ncbi:L-aspartate oxidase [Romboutsia weinsteinii]|uniref:L-aspartate oxidase n=1 Tax=Romboutsia weinsteinii TaxID=2020949 RepID=A0A371J6B4_9FIRM|nr:L-aspartate oxidase [Romboutsia weinsteinii]RDY28309.1 L-aspartate oxidase [Romboutsia weinsteinii]
MNNKVDVLIVGSGVSGLYCALNLDQSLKVLVISKSKLEENNTYLAQGGISTAKDESDIELFIQDTLKAGRYKNKLDSVKILAKESIENINKILSYGLQIDKVNGDIDYTKEGAHSTNRIVHSKDNTGEVVHKILLKEARKRKNIVILEDLYLLDIINDNGKCVGGIMINNENIKVVHSKVVVLATGGIGGIFKNSTNQRNLIGDGISISLKHNIKLKDIDYIQIHPTAFYEDDKSGRRLLISESLRGEGAKLLNKNKERFVDELLPRDIVSNAIYRQMKKDRIPYVYLDATHFDKHYLINRFKFIYEQCLEKGIDISKEYIKVSPAQHYFMGGIEVDLNSNTSMKNLFAVGEISCTGVHGANRLASNSLLEGLVFSNRAANKINSIVDIIEINTNKTVYNKLNFNCLDLNKIEEENKLMVINEIKRNRGDLQDELFDY